MTGMAEAGEGEGGRKQCLDAKARISRSIQNIEACFFPWQGEQDATQENELVEEEEVTVVPGPVGVFLLTLDHACSQSFEACQCAGWAPAVSLDLQD